MLAGRCPRCLDGNLFVEYDNQWQVNCLQCGYTAKAPREIRAKLPADYRQYQIDIPYTETPTECSFTAFTTIPSFARIR